MVSILIFFLSFIKKPPRGFPIWYTLRRKGDFMKRLTLFFSLLSAALLLAACATAKTGDAISGTDSLAQKQTTDASRTETDTQAEEPAKMPETDMQEQTTSKPQETDAQTQETAKVPETLTQTPAATTTQETGPDLTQAAGTLYIGTTDSFKEYPFSGEKTPDNLVAAIAELTGWNLSMADPITDGKGGMTVCFTKDCSIFTGPPAQQKDEFFASDNITLARMILDSIQKTLQENYVDRELGGDPSNLDIYFCTVTDDGTITDIAIPEESVSVPMEYPYQGVMIE